MKSFLLRVLVAVKRVFTCSEPQQHDPDSPNGRNCDVYLVGKIHLISQVFIHQQFCKKQFSRKKVNRSKRTLKMRQTPTCATCLWEVLKCCLSSRRRCECKFSVNCPKEDEITRRKTFRVEVEQYLPPVTWDVLPPSTSLILLQSSIPLLWSISPNSST